LTWEQLSTLAQDGAEIGGHALEHANLLKTEEQNLLPFIQQDRLMLEEKLAQKVRSFSYPFGLYDKRIAQKVAQAGYTYGFISDSGYLEDSENSFLLKRTNVGLRLPFVVEAFVEGWADAISAFMRYVKRKKA